MSRFSLIFVLFEVFQVATTKSWGDLEPVIVNVGEDVNMTCPTSSITQKYHWEIQKNSTYIKEFPGNTFLLITNTKLSDSGSYECFEFIQKEPDKDMTFNHYKKQLIVIETNCYKSQNDDRFLYSIKFNHQMPKGVVISKDCNGTTETIQKVVGNNIYVEWNPNQLELCHLVITYETASLILSRQCEISLMPGLMTVGIAGLAIFIFLFILLVYVCAKRKPKKSRRAKIKYEDLLGYRLDKNSYYAIKKLQSPAEIIPIGWDVPTSTTNEYDYLDESSIRKHTQEY